MLLGFGLALALFGLPSKEVKEVGATSFHTVWSPYGHWSNWSECEANREGEECGVVGGSRERHRTRVCLLLPGGGQNQCAFGTTDTQHQYDECEVELQACIEPTPVCTDAGAANYDPEVGENEFEDNSTCVPREPNVPQGPFGAPQCGSTAPILLPANPLVWRRGGTAIVQWQPTAGDRANVYYQEVQNPANAHAVRDTENDGYVEINELGSLDWSFGIQQSQGCAGDGVVWVIDGSTNGWTLFRL